MMFIIIFKGHKGTKGNVSLLFIYEFQKVVNEFHF